MLFFIIAAAASVIGALCGLGGGVIITPLLDTFTDFSVFQISILSAFSVLTVSVTSVIKYTTQKTGFNLLRCTFIGIGSVLGGYAGTFFLSTLISSLDASFVSAVQSGAAALLLGAAVIYMMFFKQRLSFNIRNNFAVLLAGLLLGFLSSLLSIGGGPINVALMVLLFSVSICEAAVSSLFVIAFSQTTKIITSAVTTGFGGIDLSPLWILVPTAFAGALVGAWLNKRLNKTAVTIVYNVTVCLLVLINAYNALSVFI